jgi:RNA polymerase sigma-54 factor
MPADAAAKRCFDPQNTLAQQIIAEHLKLLQNNQLKEVARALNRPVELVKRAVDVIKKLDPKPGLRYNKTEPRLVEPDVQFRKVDGEWQVFMNEDDLPQLRLSPTVSPPAGARRRRPRCAQLREGALHRRDPADEEYRAAQAHHSARLPVHHAPPGRFLDYGPDHLKPMMIKEVAEEVGVHPSTVSRAVASKYAHTPQGVLELRSFFSESVNGPQGSEMSL